MMRAAGAGAGDAAPGKTQDTSKEVLARVDGVPIYLRDFDRRMVQERRRKEKDDDAKERSLSRDEQRKAARKLRDRVIDWLIDRELLYREALRRGLQVDEKQIDARWQTIRRDLAKGEEPVTAAELARRLAKSGFTEEQYRERLRKEALVRALENELVPPAETISKKDIARCYKEYKSRFVVPERVRLSELLVAVSHRADQADLDAAMERIRTLKSRLDAGTSFEQLARESSDARSAATGGDIGWKTRGRLGGELGGLAFSLDVGKVGGPVRTRSGLVLIKVTDKQPERIYTLEEAKDNIVKYLQQQAGDLAVKKLTAELRKSADIEYVVRP